MWRKEGQIPRIRLLASYMYIPLHVHRQLGLPVIDWRKEWECDAPEGILLFHLY